MFNSRLPVPTSVRGSTSSLSSTSRSAVKNPSFGGIPSTARKANLFTPQTKKSTHVSGASTGANKQRPSIMQERKFVKDNRPLADRSYQLTCFDRLVSFLANHQYPHTMPDAKRFFQGISTTELNRLFEFLMSYFLPDFKITHIDQDVPAALRLIRYPFTVSKSNLVSTTSRQSLATLLGVFDYMVDSITYMENSRHTPATLYPEPADGSIDVQGALMRIILESDNDMEIQRKREKLEDKLYGTKDELEAKDMEIEQLKKEHSDLEQELQKKYDLEEELDMLKKDVESLRDYNKQMDEHLKNQEAQKSKQDEEKARLLLEQDKLLQELANCQERVKNQRLTPEQVKWHLTEQARYRAKIQDEETKIEKLRRDKVKTDTDLSRHIDELDKHLESTLSYLNSFHEDLKTDLWSGLPEESRQQLISMISPVTEKLKKARSNDPEVILELSGYARKHWVEIDQTALVLLKKANDEYAAEDKKLVAILNQQDEKLRELKLGAESGAKELARLKLDGAAKASARRQQIKDAEDQKAELLIQIKQAKEKVSKDIADKRNENEQINRRNDELVAKKISQLLARAANDRKQIRASAETMDSTLSSLRHSNSILAAKEKEATAGIELLRPHLKRWARNSRINRQ